MIGTLSAALALTAVGAASAAPTEPSEPTSSESGSRFTLAVLPDTQFYSRYAEEQFEPRYGTNPFAVQTQWLAENQDELNIPFVAHLGDVVDQVGQKSGWRAADAAMQTLEDAALPYSVLPGNHDLLDSDPNLTDQDYDLAEEPYLDWFPPERAAAQPTQGGTDATGLNQYQIFEAEGQKYLVLALAWRASEETIAWADQVMADHPTLPTILTTHSLINVAGDGLTAISTEYGERLWQKLIAPNDQIFLTLNGHFHGTTYRTRTNLAGNTVTQILMDHQMAYEGGNGYLGLLEFDLERSQIEVQTLSPWVAYKPQDALTAHDQPVLDGPTEHYTLDINFAERFRSFNQSFGPGNGEYPPLLERARALLLADFDGPEPATSTPPGSSQDYVRVDGTVAHWRPGATEGGKRVLPGHGVVPDVTQPANNLYRVPAAQSGSPTAESGDVTITGESHPLSSDGAAVCFANSDQATDRFSYLTTAKDAPVNNADFSAGYTIETFVRLAPEWTVEANSWSKAVVRTGNRSRLEGMPEVSVDATASPAALGISSLRELQWTGVPADATSGGYSAWSSEVLIDRWMHVAVVNDGDLTTMYVNGIPVLRKATDSGGMSFTEDMPWILGSDWVDDAATNGWHGCIGETRIIDHPTEPEQWLTARPNLNTDFTLTSTQVTLTDGASSAVLNGTGAPGARVQVTGPMRGTADVNADGSWSVKLLAAQRERLTPGRYEVSVTQGFGDRRSAPETATFIVHAGEEEAPPPPGALDPDGAPDSPDPSSPAPGGHEAQKGGDTADRPGSTEAEQSENGDDLAVTGAGAVGLTTGVALLLLAAGFGVLLRRRTH